MTAISPAENLPLPALQEDYSLLKSAVAEAGALALASFRTEVGVKRKLDGSEVSDVDLAVDALLKAKLMGARPDYGWLSEETPDDARRLDKRRVWMVDPIDGTNAFLRHVPEWTVSAALVEDGVPVIGIVFNPAQREFFHAVRGQGAFLDEAPMHVSGQSTLEGARIIASGGLFKKRIWAEPWPEVKSRWVNSVAYRMALVAAARADATVSLSAKSEWDIAAATLLIEEAHGVVTDHRGDALVFNRETPRFSGLVASTAGLHPILIERTSRIDL
jgi:myo-inositol-1(or 4)-monophosphatase